MQGERHAVTPAASRPGVWPSIAAASSKLSRSRDHEAASPPDDVLSAPRPSPGDAPPERVHAEPVDLAR
jgi:hypothetical protein